MVQKAQEYVGSRSKWISLKIQYEIPDVVQ